VEEPGVRASQAAGADPSVAVHPDQPGGRPHAAPLGEVVEERDGLVVGQVRAEQGRPFPLREPVAAGAAVEQTMLLLVAVPATDRQVAGPTLAVVEASLVLAAEAGKVLIHGGTSVTLRRRKERISSRKSFVYQKLTEFQSS
jgi:hypothetical protein